MVTQNILNLAYFVPIQIETLQNKCKVQSSTFATGNPLIQVL